MQYTITQFGNAALKARVTFLSRSTMKTMRRRAAAVSEEVEEEEDEEEEEEEEKTGEDSLFA
jgi:hypothetical protein